MTNFKNQFEDSKAFEILTENEAFLEVYFSEYSKEERIEAFGEELAPLNDEWFDIVEQDGIQYAVYHSYSDNTANCVSDLDFSIKI